MFVSAFAVVIFGLSCYDEDNWFYMLSYWWLWLSF